MSLLEATDKKPRGDKRAVMPQTLHVSVDEKAYALVERNFLTADYKEERRWQFIYVLRDGEVAEWVRDLGPAKNFTAPEYRLFSLFEDSVGHLMELADKDRWGDDYWQKYAAEKRAESTIVDDFKRYIDEALKQKANQSTFGPAFNRQRNLFARRK